MRPSFYSIDLFPKLKELADNWEIIQKEFQELNAPLMEVHRVAKTHDEIFNEVNERVQKGVPYGWLHGWTFGRRANHNWLQYPLVLRDKIVPFVEKGKMKKTLQMLRKIKGIKVCALSRMKPNYMLGVHQHSQIFDEGMLQFHIPISTARQEKNFNYFNVNGEMRQHVCGEPLVFDGSLDHFALNASHEERTIVYMEFYKDKLMTGKPKKRRATRKTTSTRKKKTA